MKQLIRNIRMRRSNICHSQQNRSMKQCKFDYSVFFLLVVVVCTVNIFFSSFSSLLFSNCTRFFFAIFQLEYDPFSLLTVQLKQSVDGYLIVQRTIMNENKILGREWEKKVSSKVYSHQKVFVFNVVSAYKQNTKRNVTASQWMRCLTEDSIWRRRDFSVIHNLIQNWNKQKINQLPLRMKRMQLCVCNVLTILISFLNLGHFLKISHCHDDTGRNYFSCFHHQYCKR